MIIHRNSTKFMLFPLSNVKVVIVHNDKYSNVTNIYVLLYDNIKITILSYVTL